MKSGMEALYAQYPVTKQVLAEKKGFVPAAVRKRNQSDWFSLAIEKKANKIKNKKEA